MRADNSQRSKCEVWSRVVGYLRPTSAWNEGKQSEFKDRMAFNLKGGNHDDKRNKN